MSSPVVCLVERLVPLLPSGVPNVNQELLVLLRAQVLILLEAHGIESDLLHLIEMIPEAISFGNGCLAHSFLSQNDHFDRGCVGYLLFLLFPELIRFQP